MATGWDVMISVLLLEHLCELCVLWADQAFFLEA